MNKKLYKYIIEAFSGKIPGLPLINENQLKLN